MAGRISGRGGAANVHANHVRQTALRHMMYDVEATEEAVSLVSRVYHVVCEAMFSLKASA